MRGMRTILPGKHGLVTASLTLVVGLLGCGGGSKATSTAGTGGSTPDGGTSSSSSGAGTGGSAGTGGGAGTGGTGPSDAGPPADVTITVDRATTVATIGPNVAGLSYEKDHLNDGFFTPTNAALIGLFKRLGTSILRIGGNSVDKTTWSATGPGGTAGVIAPPDVDALAGFLAATNWTVLYGVNMAADDPTLAAAEAAYAAKSLGAHLYGFEIGNECDLYPINGDRPTTWTYDDFVAQWKTFYTPMHTSAPGAVFTGPASASDVTTWTVPFAKDAAADIVLLTQHYYRGNGALATSTLAELLLPDPSLITQLGDLDAAVKANNTPRGYRLSEANSFYNGGAPGISDGYGTALWVVDFLFTNVAHGSAGVNLHGGGDGTGYTPIADLNSVVVEARPDYYGMFLFDLAGQGTLFGTTVTATPVNFTAYAVGPADGTTNMVLVNKDPAVTVHATVDLGKAATTGTLTLLTGPSLGATTGFTIGGVPVNPDGSWTPTTSPTLPVTGTTLVVDVPPASAELIKVQ
jgi:hypothetical protein